MMIRAKRILLAEDEGTLRDFVSRNLRARGFEVLEASNGLEAMALWEREAPHLLILDIMMPRMDGLEVCRRVREHSAVPIIVLTALDAESDKVTALDLGADAEYLRVYINRLRQKLEADPANPRYLLTEPGVGYRFVAPEIEGMRKYPPFRNSGDL